MDQDTADNWLTSCAQIWDVFNGTIRYNRTDHDIMWYDSSDLYRGWAVCTISARMDIVDKLTVLKILRFLWNDITWWRHQMETFSALLALCAGNSPDAGEFPAQRPVTRSFDVFFYLRLSKRLVNNREAGDAIGPILTLSGPFWRHCNDQMTFSVIFNIFLTTFVENLLITLHILRTKEIIDKYDKMCYTYVNMTVRDAQIYRRKDNALKTSHCWCSIKYICAQCDKKFQLYVLLY